MRALLRFVWLALAMVVVLTVACISPAVIRVTWSVIKTIFDPITLIGVAGGLVICVLGLIILQRQREFLGLLQELGYRIVSISRGISLRSVEALTWRFMVKKLHTQQVKLAGNHPANNEEQWTAVSTMTQNESTLHVVESIALDPSTPEDVRVTAIKGIKEKELIGTSSDK